MGNGHLIVKRVSDDITFLRRGIAAHLFHFAAAQKEEGYTEKQENEPYFSVSYTEFHTTAFQKHYIQCSQ